MRQADAAELRREWRAVLAAEIDADGFDPAAGSWGPADLGFAARLGARGWIGASWPCALGGQGGSTFSAMSSPRNRSPIGPRCG